MKNLSRQSSIVKSAKQASGFSLAELLVSLAIFLVISAGAISLVKAHVPLANTAQNQSGLNIALQNSVAQMQSDVINAGSGYYTGLNQADNPIGLTIVNCGDVVNGCNNASGNDTLNVISVASNVPPAQPTDSTGGTASTNCSDATTNTIYLAPPSGTTAAALAALYLNGDYILLRNVTTGGSLFTTTKVTANGAVSGSLVKLTIDPVNSNGTAATTGISSNGTWSDDPFYITQDASRLKSPPTFCYTTDWVMKLAPMITYSVNGSNQLTRNGVVLSDQVLGFKVGAMTWNTGSTIDQSTYVFSAPNQTPAQGCTPSSTTACGFNNDWTLIRSVMISLIGRTSASITSGFTNTFDGGAYQVQAVSVVINPRNLSMRDNVSN